VTLALGTPAPKPRRKALDRDRAAPREAERQLLLRYRRWGDLAAREELVERFLPLARDLARRYTYTGEPFDDLLQVASLGLVNAIDRFDPERGAKFTTYAAPTILGELKRHFRDKGWALHVPRDLQDRALALGRETEALSRRFGRSPKMDEVAAALGCSVEYALEALEAAGGYQAVSLDTPTAKYDYEAAALVDLLGEEDPAYELVEDRDAIGGAWLAMSEPERKLLELRFIHELPKREIAQRIGCSPLHVSRLLRRALSRLQRAAAAAA
jgi:RNA polymerase sigma-B factor